MRIALLGAGFSRNWGGLLAHQVLHSILHALIDRHPELHARLLARGNFEEVLGELQQQARTGDPVAAERLQAMEIAILGEFQRMNQHFATRVIDLDFSNPVERSVHAFLARFDAIFTLNQDLLLECHYRPELRLVSPGNRRSCRMAG